MLLLLITAVECYVPASLDYHADRFAPAFIETRSGESIVTLEEGFIGTLPGFPDLPFLAETIPLDPGTRAITASIAGETWETVTEGLRVRPLPEPAVLSLPAAEDYYRYEEVYTRGGFWPDEPISLVGTGFVDGVPCAELVVSPFRFDPLTGELQRLVAADIRLETAENLETPVPCPGRDGLDRMLIITDQSIRVPFDSLAMRRTEEGIPTEVVTTDQVYSTPGSDDPERIRNYIIDRYQADGFTMVLLGGDTNQVPCRFAYPMSYEMSGGREDNMPCDLYYSDLDGDWNYDGDDIWGEVADSVDLWQDIRVGRAPCEDISEAWTFYNKIKLYESTDPGHLDDTILAGGVLWEEPFTDEAVVKGYIRDNYIPSWFTHTELYQTSGNYTTASVIAALNQGAGYVNLNDHGWTSIVGCLTNGDVDIVDSDGRYFGMMYSIGCWTSAFDYDCVSEHFLNNINGCGVSYIGNSSYGWGSPGNPLFGYSDRFDRELFRILFEEPSLDLGELVAATKDSFIPFAGQENCYRCVLYMVNLLGDPSMHTFRNTPSIPVVECPELVTGYTLSLPVSVSVPGGIQPGEITVCIHDEDFGIYEVEELDGSGSTVFQLDSPPQGDMTVTVTGTDLRRSQVVIPNASGPYPTISAISVTTPEGYSHPAPGSSPEVTVTLTNTGNETLSGVELTAQLVSGPGTLEQPSVSYGELTPGTSSQGAQVLELTVEEDAAAGEVLQLEVQISADQGVWTSSLPLLVYAPGLFFCGYTVDDSAGGNGNGYAEPGETFDLIVEVANSGLLAADDVTAVLSTQEEWLVWNTDSCFVTAVEPETTSGFSFQGEILGSAPDTAFPAVSLVTTASPQWSSEEDFLFIVGEFLSSSDFETGEQNWTHQGNYDQWHLSQQETHSGEWAWWCGNEETGGYQENMDCSLISPTLLLAPEAELSFWSCFDVDLYGADGLYVIVRRTDQSVADTLDFIGAGGLLGTSGIRSKGNMTWLPRNYPFPEYPPGTPVQVEFSFHTDDSEANQGSFHIDDVVIDGYLQLNGAQEPEQPFVAGLPWPNPSCGIFFVPLNATEGPWSVQVFDLAGRMVHSVSSRNPYTGNLQIQLERPCAGVYLLRAVTENGEEVRRAVVYPGGR